jgi:RNA polymerase sigma factor (sigma-70 family)
MEEAPSLSSLDLGATWEMVYNISVGFLHNGAEAEDATQEIMIKAIKAFPGFRGESAVETWIYRIAHNHLVDSCRGFGEEISFELFEEDVGNFEPYRGQPDLSPVELGIYVEEIKVGCTKAMLQCLEPEDRFAYIIGNVFGFDGQRASGICGISEAAYRQRLSRANRKVTSFMSLNCGLLNPEATCHCRKRILVALERERINPDMLLHRAGTRKISDFLAGMNEIDGVARIFRDNPFHEVKDKFSREMAEMVSRLSGTTA